MIFTRDTQNLVPILFARDHFYYFNINVLPIN